MRVLFFLLRLPSSPSLKELLFFCLLHFFFYNEIIKQKYKIALHSPSLHYNRLLPYYYTAAATLLLHSYHTTLPHCCHTAAGGGSGVVRVVSGRRLEDEVEFTEEGGVIGGELEVGEVDVRPHRAQHAVQRQLRVGVPDVVQRPVV